MNEINPTSRKSSDLSEQRPDFRQPFDGTQPEVDRSEQLEVARRFESLIQDVILRNIEHQETYGSPEPSRSLLALDLPAEDGSQLSIHIWTSDTDKHPDDSPIRLSLQEKDANGKGSSSVICYDLSKEKDTVTRMDTGKRKNKGFADQIPEPDYSDTTPEGMEKNKNKIEAWISAKKEDMKNIELEREMGLLYPPINIEELSKLENLLDEEARRQDQKTNSNT